MWERPICIPDIRPDAKASSGWLEESLAKHQGWGEKRGAKGTGWSRAAHGIMVDFWFLKEIRAAYRMPTNGW